MAKITNFEIKKMNKNKLTKDSTRIQKKNINIILEAALEVFAKHGFSGTTLDQISAQAGLSKPNILYYFTSKEAIHLYLLQGLLEKWLKPLRELNPNGDPITEITSYVERKLEMSKMYPRESKLFAIEILQGASPLIIQPHIPAIQGIKGFETKRQASIIGNYMIYKINNGIMPPSISVQDLDSLKIVY